MLTALFEDTRKDYNHIFSFVTLMIPVNTSDVTNFNNKNMAATRKFKLRNSQRNINYNPGTSENYCKQF